MRAVGEVQPAPKAWADRTLPEKLEAVLDEAGAQAPAGVSLSEFQCYAAYGFLDADDVLVEAEMALVRKENPDAVVFEAKTSRVGVRTFWVVFKREPVFGVGR